MNEKLQEIAKEWHPTKIKNLSETNPELAKEWNPTKNGSLTPSDVTAGSNKSVWWLLPYDDPKTGKHFDFEWKASIANRNKSMGCPYLSGRAVWEGFNDLATTHPELVKEWHPTKNGDLTPQKVTTQSNKKVWWLLPYDDPKTGKHFDFEWEARVYDRAKGFGCPYLSGRSIRENFNNLATTHPEIAKQWHPTKNGELTPEMVTAQSNKKVWWLVPYENSETGEIINFEFESTVQNRVKAKKTPFSKNKETEL